MKKSTEKILEIYRQLDNGEGTRAELAKILIKYPKDDGVLKKICRHPKVTGELIKKICEKTDSIFVLNEASKSGKFPVNIMSYTFEKGRKIHNKKIKELINSGGGMLLDWTQQLQENFSKNPKCPKPLLDIFSEHYEIHIKVAVAENPNISQETAKKLIKYRSVRVKKALEKNSSVKFD